MVTHVKHSEDALSLFDGLADPPKCSMPGCHNPAWSNGSSRHKDGYRQYKPLCTKHTTAYRSYKDIACANTDGRLGFICKAEIIDPCQLHVDHIDNHKENDNLNNFQTLCGNCHAMKTKLFGRLTGKEIEKIFEENINSFKDHAE